MILVQVLLGIILLLSWTEGVNINDMKFTMVEYFSGKGNVSNMFKNDSHHNVASFELKNSKSMDMNSSAGFTSLAFYCSSFHISKKFGSPFKQPAWKSEFIWNVF